MEKSTLRKIYKEKRKQFSPNEIKQLSEGITKNFQQHFDITNVQNIHIFLPIEKQKEVNTWDLIHYFWDNEKNVFVPKISNSTMQSHQLTPKTSLEKNQWNILEPNNSPSQNIHFDIVITPLLYCDNQGNRVGYGKGFYDQFFQNSNANALKIGLNYFPPNEKITDISPLDIPLDYLITPTEVLSFGDLISKSTK